MRKLTIYLCCFIFVTVITNVLNPFTEYAMENSPYVEEGEKVGQETKTEVPSQPWTDEEVIVLTKMLWGEAGSVPSDTEKAAVVWCALNHVDAGYGDIITAVTIPGHFVGYRENNPVDADLKSLCEDVLSRWYAEKDGKTDVGRVLPKDYIYFSGDGTRNYFRNTYEGGDRWDWSLPSPYES